MLSSRFFLTTLAFFGCHLSVFSQSKIDSVQHFKEVEVLRKQGPRMEMTTRNVELISSADLVKDACCNLSESFENSATVDVNYSDAVSGAKEIRMLGLDGVYSQIMLENIPSVRGLGNTFGMAYIPGPWMSSIQVNKGAGSVVNGFETTTGQINVELKKPQTAERFFVNLFLNQDARTELNLYTAHRLRNEKWSTALLVHGQINFLKVDMNKDGFIDNPLVKEGNVMSRWTYQSGKYFNFISAINVLAEDRRGGELKYDFKKSNNVQTNWGLQLKTLRTEAFAKTGFNLHDNTSSLGVQYKYYFQQQNGFIGKRNYDAKEHFGYVNFIYQKSFDKPDDILKIGASFQTNYTSEKLDSFQLKRTEFISGVFTEATYDVKKKLNIIAGLRLDYHNLYGTFLSPRVNLKWNILYYLSLRLSAGKGYRVPVVFAENYGLLSNNRKIELPTKILPEKAWNYGASLTYKFFLDFREGTITVDYYRTDFQNQLVIDLEDVRSLRFYNLKGKSFSNSVQAEVQYEVIKNLDVKLGYKFDDVRTTYDGVLKQVPLRPRHKGLVSLEYKTNNKKWRFNTHLTWYGKARVPDTSPNDMVNQRPISSKDFFLWNAQITYTLKQKWDFYIGTENMLNQIQNRAIIANDAPFSKQFDASLVWGQLRGAMVFAGFRFALK